MNGEYYMEMACGFYDEFREKLYQGEITLEDVIQLYKYKKITQHQYRCGIDFLEMKD